MFRSSKKKKQLRWCAVMLTALLVIQAGAVSAFAAEFTDGDKIAPEYRTAVEEMTGQSVLEGFPDGSFGPYETLSREQGAKIVTVMVLREQARNLVCSVAPFKDVKAKRWSAPYISWCAGQQILLGYGEGVFGPEDTLTGDQFTKMLLCAKGLARPGNYVGLGSGWTKAVREDARAAGLYDGDPSMETDKPITRQQAALLSHNCSEAAEAAAAATGGAITSGGAVVPGGGGAAGGGVAGGGAVIPSGGAVSGGGSTTGGGSTSGQGTSSSGGISQGTNGDILLPEVP